MFKVPLMRPALPPAASLLPLIREIDLNAQYTNFGPLHDLYLTLLLKEQINLEKEEIHGVLTCNGTAALELAIASLHLPHGSVVGVPAFTFPATATAVLRCGHRPLFLDINPESWLTTVDQVCAPRLVSKLKAIVPVATFGMPQDVEAWTTFSERYGIPVVIDAAAAFGAQKSSENISVVFSLHATKSLSCVEGGLVINRNIAHTERLRQMTNFGIGFSHLTASTNAKLSEYHAAVGIAHLSTWREQVKNRWALLSVYKDFFLKMGISVNYQSDTGMFVPSVFVVRFHDRLTRDKVESACDRAHIQTRRWYCPLLTESGGPRVDICVTGLPNASALADEMLGLPFFIGMTTEQVEFVASTVAEAIN